MYEMRVNVSHPCKTTGEIRIILIAVFLDRLEDEGWRIEW
jgi:hypothetical protein